MKNVKCEYWEYYCVIKAAIKSGLPSITKSNLTGDLRKSNLALEQAAEQKQLEYDKLKEEIEKERRKLQK